MKLSGTNNKIAIIGPYPPPYGGISVHIERILKYVPENSYHFYNVQKNSKTGRPFHGIWKFFYIICFIFSRYRIIHYHSTSMWIRLSLSCLSLIKKGVHLHLHGESFTDAIKQKSISSYVLKKLIPYTHFIASNEDLFNKIAPYHPKSLHIIDAFLPPLFNQHALESFNKKVVLPDTRYRIGMVGWFITYKSQDLYGFDIALDALHLLRSKFNTDISIIASVNGIKEKKLYDQFILQRGKYNLKDYFILIEEELEELFPLYLNTHIFIRPTNTDGNSVSIKEALWFRCPVIASDAVVRPEPVILFKNRNTKNLAEKILFSLENNHFLSLNEKIEYIKSKKYTNPLIKDVYGLEP